MGKNGEGQGMTEEKRTRLGLGKGLEAHVTRISWSWKLADCAF